MSEPKITSDVLLLETEDLLRNAPSREELTPGGKVNFGWLGRAGAVVNQWSVSRYLVFMAAQSDLQNINGFTNERGYATLMALLHEAQHDLRMRTQGPINIALGKGQVFPYFDEVKDLVQQAVADVFFVDAYLDDAFVSRYLTHAKSGVSIRLLTSPDPRRLTKLQTAIGLFVMEYKQSINLRTTLDLHDRYLLVDHTRCFSSGASFKDGAKNAGTTILEMVDVFKAVKSTCDALWMNGTVVQ